MAATSHSTLHLGFDATEIASSPYSPYFRPAMAALTEHVREALATGGLAPALLPPVQAAPDLQRAGYWPVETGLNVAPTRPRSCGLGGRRG